MSQLLEVQVPDIGDFKDVEVIELLVKPGDTVSKEQSLVTVESDKASMEIPSSAAGVIKQLLVKLGDKVSQGSSLVVVESGDAKAAAPAPAPSKAAPPKPAAAPPAAAKAPAPPPAPAPARALARAAPPKPPPAPPAAAKAPAPPPATASAASLEVVVPDIGDFKDVEVIEVLVKPGDKVAKEQSLITVESDKASMEIPSSAAGVVKELRVKLGDQVSQGSPIAPLSGGTAASTPPAAERAAAPAAKGSD